MYKYLANMIRVNLHFKQIATLFSVNICSIPLSLASSILITKILGPIGFGNYTFLLNVFGLAIVIFDFGLFQACNRALILHDDKTNSREYYGAMLIYLLFVSVAMSLFMMIYVYYDKNIYDKELYSAVKFITPFCWIFLLPKIYETLFQADNRIIDLAISRILPTICNILFFSLTYFFFKYNTFDRLEIILSLYLTSQLIVFIFLAYRIKPTLYNVKKRLLEIYYYAKIYGFHVYTGSIFAVGMSQMSGIFISYFSLNNAGVGHFSLSLAFSMPLKLIPNIIATTHYKKFSQLINLPGKLTKYTVIVSIISLILLWIIIQPLVSVCYGESFSSVTNLTIIISTGMFFHGMADYINRFLGSHGKGKILRNSAIIVALVLLITNLVLIPIYGEIGAALSQLISGIVYFVTMLIYYKLYIRNFFKTV